jgi:hypothetical protein
MTPVDLFGRIMTALTTRFGRFDTLRVDRTGAGVFSAPLLAAVHSQERGPHLPRGGARVAFGSG